MAYICHSGGAEGSDTFWETEGEKYAVQTIAYSFNGHDTTSYNRYVLSEADLNEGWEKVLIANQSLKRKIQTGNQYTKNLVSRNWFQVKNATAVFAIGEFINIQRIHVSGGTAWAVQMAKDNNKPIYLFNQMNNAWFIWSYQYGKFLQYFVNPTLTENFAGIGTRRLNDLGRNAITEIYKNTFNNE